MDRVGLPGWWSSHRFSRNWTARTVDSSQMGRRKLRKRSLQSGWHQRNWLLLRISQHLSHNADLWTCQRSTHWSFLLGRQTRHPNTSFFPTHLHLNLPIVQWFLVASPGQIDDAIQYEPHSLLKQSEIDTNKRDKCADQRWLSKILCKVISWIVEIEVPALVAASL